MVKRLGLACCFLFVSLSLQAQETPQLPASVAPLETLAKQAILIDEATGTVLFDKNADERMPTSSMVKVLTMYLTFDALQDGKIRLDQTQPVSEHAWRQEGSRTFLNLGENAKIEDLIRGVIVQSGNDAAVALAEAVGGSEGNFAGMMNTKAQQLGMNSSHFMNATGLPDPNHYSTARDLARLAMAVLRDHKDFYHYYSETEFTHNGIKQGNRNPLLYRGIGVDGLKTGHTEEAGFGLIASSVREGRRLVLVVNGLGSMQQRADEPAKILDWGYREFGLFDIVKKDQKMATAKTWLGVQPEVSLVAGRGVSLTLPRAARQNVEISISYDEPVKAPVAKGQEIGRITVKALGMEPTLVPLVAEENVDQVGFWGKLSAKIGLLLGSKK